MKGRVGAKVIQVHLENNLLVVGTKPQIQSRISISG